MWSNIIKSTLLAYRGKLSIPSEQEIFQNFQTSNQKQYSDVQTQYNRVSGEFAIYKKDDSGNVYQPLLNIIQRLASDTVFVDKWLLGVVASMNAKIRHYQRSLQKEKDQLDREMKKLREDTKNKFKDLNVPHSDTEVANYLTAGTRMQTYDLMSEKLHSKEHLVKHAYIRAVLSLYATKPGYDVLRQYLRNKLVLSLFELVKMKHLESQRAICTKLESFMIDAGLMQDHSLTFMIAGSPGTGKTTLAKKIADILGTMGALVFDTLVESTRGDFVAEYLGQSVAKTRRLLNSTLEQVLFIDEAYALSQYTRNVDGSRQLDSYSEEAINELTGFMSNHLGKICIIVAGYQDEMYKDFLPSNIGLERRFDTHFKIDDKSPFELSTMFVRILQENLCKLGNTVIYESTRKYLEDIITEVYAHKGEYTCLYRFVRQQAGAIVELAKSAIQIHMSFLYRDKHMTTEELFRLILRSKTRDGDDGKPRLPEIDRVLSRVSLDVQLTDKVSECITKPIKGDENLQIEALDKDIFEVTQVTHLSVTERPSSPLT